MTRKFFVDTGAFLALANQADQYHESAKKYLDELLASKPLLVTSNFVLDETYTRIRRKSGLKSAIAFGENIQASRQIKVFSIDRGIDKKAWEIFKQYDDHLFSYTDCTSFALMRFQKISHVFAFDNDFRIMGFTVCPFQP